MTNRSKRTVVTIAGRSVALTRAALMAKEAQRRKVLLRDVGPVVIPKPPPTHVKIAGKLLTLEAAACIAEEADRKRLLPKEVMERIVTRRAQWFLRKERRGEA